MPKILLFAACEKVIVDAQSNSSTLIALLDNISIPAPEGKLIPQEAVSPMQWGIFALWSREPGDEGQLYEQRTYLKQAGVSPKVDGTVTFEMLDQKQNVTANVTGFPVGVPGEAVVVLSYRKAGTGDSWQEVAQYPVQVMHDIAPAALAPLNLDKV